MTLTDVLRINQRFLQYDDGRKLDYCEARWREHGCPVEKWQLVNFLEKMLRELLPQGGYPRVLLLRKKEIARGAFIPPKPGELAGNSAAASCKDCHGSGWKNGPKGYTPCACEQGNGPRLEVEWKGKGNEAHASV